MVVLRNACVATLPDARHDWFSARACVSLQWQGEVASYLGNFCLSVAARQIVKARFVHEMCVASCADQAKQQQQEQQQQQPKKKDKNTNKQKQTKQQQKPTETAKPNQTKTKTKPKQRTAHNNNTEVTS